MVRAVTDWRSAPRSTGDSRRVDLAALRPARPFRWDSKTGEADPMRFMHLRPAALVDSTTPFSSEVASIDTADVEKDVINGVESVQYRRL